MDDVHSPQYAAGDAPPERRATRQADGMRAARRPTGPILGLVVFLVATVLGQLPTLPFLSEDTGPMSLAQQLLLTLGFLGTAAVVLLWVRFKEGRPLGTLGFVRAGAGRQLAIGVVVALLFVAAVSLPALVSGQASMGASDAGAIGAVLLLLVGFCVQGSTEELCTRGYATQVVAFRWGWPAAFVVQAVLFAALHGANGGLTVFSWLNLLGVALFLGLWVRLSESLWGACAFHAVWNWAQGNLWGAPVSNQAVQNSIWHYRPEPGASDALTGGGFGLEGSAVATAVFVVGIVVLAVLLRRRGGAAGRPAARGGVPAA